MAQLNITLNQEEILQLLSNDKSEAFAKLLQESLNGILKAESTAQLQAEPYERTSERKGSRNGFRDRPYVTHCLCQLKIAPLEWSTSAILSFSPRFNQLIVSLTR